MSIVTYPLDGITYNADNVAAYLCTRTSGVYADEDCFDISITDDMEVTVSPGLAWVRNSDFAGKSICLDEAQALTIDAASASYPRTDRIILKFDKEANATTLEMLEGTPSSSADPPDIEQTEEVYELGLYEIYVEAGAEYLTASCITDTRLDEEVCGLMRDAVTTIPTATLQESALEVIESLKTEIAGVKAGSSYMLKSTYDSEGGEKQVAFKEDVGELIEEYLPFMLAISDDGEYGYYDLEGNFQSFKVAVGDATEADVLSGVTFSSAEIYGGTGTMENQGAVNVTINSGSTYTIPEGYHNGSGKVTANSLANQTSANATAARILNGYTAWVNGSKITGNMTSRGNVSSTINCGSTYNISAGYHAGGGKITVNSLANQTNATATAARILNGYTAYVNGSKITGNMTNRGNVTAYANPGGSYTISAGYHGGGGKVTGNAVSIYTRTVNVNVTPNSYSNVNFYLANNTFVSARINRYRVYNTSNANYQNYCGNLSMSQSGNYINIYLSGLNANHMVGVFSFVAYYYYS